MNTIKLLLVEDDDSLAFIVKGSLELTGNYNVCTASNGKEGIEAYKTFQPDVIVSDIEMPEMSGEEFVSEIRLNDQQVPILFATAKTSPQDLIRGYEFEIDNYIRKPYLCEELDVQIRNILKRRGKIITPVVNTDSYPLGNILFNVKHHYLQANEKHIKLTPRQTDILWILYENKGTVVKRETILEKFWNNTDFYSSRSLDVFIQKLRTILLETPSIKIRTERGEGYMLVIE